MKDAMKKSALVVGGIVALWVVIVLPPLLLGPWAFLLSIPAALWGILTAAFYFLSD